MIPWDIRRIGLPSGGSVAVLVLAAFMLCLLSVNLGANDLIGGDEGYYGVMARNIRHGWTYLASPSLSPLGPPGDKPFLYPLILAGALQCGGIGEVPMRWVTLLISIGTGLLIYLVGRELGQPRAGLWAAALYYCTPLLGYDGRRIAAEVPLVAFSLLGAWLFLRSLRTGSRGLALLAGGFFGLGFLCKLWLITAPRAAVRAGALELMRRQRVRPLVSVRRSAGGGVICAMLAGLLGVGSLQILLCLLTAPRFLEHWIRIYFGFSLASRVAGEGFADYWHRPWSFYPLAIGRSLSLWLPALAMGLVALPRLVRREQGVEQERVGVPLVLCVWLLPLLPMSLVSVKSGGYVEPLLPALFLIAGLGLDSLLLQLDGESRAPHALLAALLAAVFCLASQLSFVSGAARPTVHSGIPALLQCAWIVALGAYGLYGRTRIRMARGLLGACLAASLLAGLARNVQIVREHDHVTNFRRIAARLAPGLRDVAPQEPCFYSPEWPSMSFYTFRSGRYWESPYVPADREGVVRALRSDRPFFFVVDVRGRQLYGGAPDAETRAAIAWEGHPVATGQDGKPLGATVYVNHALHRALTEADTVEPEAAE